MTSPDAAAPGQFTIRDRAVTRLGFGAMRLTGTGIWGAPSDRDEAIRVLKRLPELGVNFIDTADSYGPYISEDLIAEALYPYGEMFIATKGGLTRTGPNVWPPVGRPEYLLDIHPIASLSHRKRFDLLSQGIPTSETAKVASPMGWLTTQWKQLP